MTRETGSFGMEKQAPHPLCLRHSGLVYALRGAADSTTVQGAERRHPKWNDS
jgi:hypothetical protein